MIKECFKELMNLDLYEEEHGFILFRIDGKFVYIYLMYVKPEHRKSHYAKNMADNLCKKAKEHLGCTHLMADIQPSNLTATMAMKVLIAYGMEVKEANHDEIILTKEIE
jgi:ribosomal protein S18 acetylase RimI-like enzyme